MCSYLVPLLHIPFLDDSDTFITRKGLGGSVAVEIWRNLVPFAFHVIMTAVVPLAVILCVCVLLT